MITLKLSLSLLLFIPFISSFSPPIPTPLFFLFFFFFSKIFGLHVLTFSPSEDLCCEKE